MTPARTPCARSCVQTTITTVTIITTEDCHGWYRMSLIERHEKVPIETMIMTATSEAIGMIATSGPSTSVRNSGRLGAAGLVGFDGGRAEERRGGKGWGRTWRYRWG